MGEIEQETRINPEMVQHNQKQELPKRLHGFTWPFHPAQLASWLVFGFNLCCFYMLVTISLDNNLGLCLFASIFYGLLIIFVVYYGYFSTRIDPSDPTVAFER